MTEEQKNAYEQAKPTGEKNTLKDLLARNYTIDKFLKIEAEEKQPEATFFWPKRDFSTRLIDMAAQSI